MHLPDSKLDQLLPPASSLSTETEMIARIAAHLQLPSLIEHLKRLKHPVGSPAAGTGTGAGSADK